MKNRSVVLTKLILSLSLVWLITACGSTPKPQHQKVAILQYQLGLFDIELSQNHQAEGFYSQEEMQAYVKKKTLALMKESGLILGESAGAATVNVKVYYYRAFAGEATPWPSDSITRPRVAFNLDAKRNEEKLFQVAKKDLTFVGGFFDNLKTSLTMDLGNSNKEAEHQYLDALAGSIVNTIIRQQ